jgi:hypothetical protein
MVSERTTGVSDMANIKFFVDLASGETLVSNKADYDQGSSKMPRIWTQETGWLRATRKVEYKKFASKHECDARCINATGLIMKCECSCGGKNHGKGSSLICR